MSKRLMVGMLLKTPNADPYTQNTYIINDDAVVLIFCVNSGDQGVAFAKAFADSGFDRIEMCPEFIADEVEMVKHVVAGRALVGIVKFCGCKLCSPCLLDRD